MLLNLKMRLLEWLHQGRLKYRTSLQLQLHLSPIILGSSLSLSLQLSGDIGSKSHEKHCRLLR